MTPFIAKRKREGLKLLKIHVEAGTISPIIDRTYILDQIPDAVRDRAGEFNPQFAPPATCKKHGEAGRFPLGNRSSATSPPRSPRHQIATRGTP